MTSKRKLFFYVSRGHEHGYDHTRITVFEAEHRELEAAIDGCIDNKAGYGNESAAAKLQACFEEAKRRGYTHQADPWFTDDARVTLHWQHYDVMQKQYCEPRVEVGDQYPKLKVNMQLAERVMRNGMRELYPDQRPHTSKRGISDPEQVLRALKRMRATQVDRPRLGPNHWDTFFVFPAQAPQGAEEAA